MPQIDSAEEAIKKSEVFLEKYHIYHQLKRAAREKDRWITEFDVAIVGSEIVRIVLDAQTGNIIEYGKVGV
jgi:hypothetical protein